MAFKLFYSRGATAQLTQLSRLLAIANLLVGDCPEELAYPQSTGVSRSAAGGQDVVGSDALAGD